MTFKPLWNKYKGHGWVGRGCWMGIVAFLCARHLSATKGQYVTCIPLRLILKYEKSTLGLIDEMDCPVGDKCPTSDSV